MKIFPEIFSTRVLQSHKSFPTGNEHFFIIIRNSHFNLKKILIKEFCYKNIIKTN